LLLVPAPALAQAETARTFLLIAQPICSTRIFPGRWCWSCHPEESGPLGVILNRPTNVQLRELYPERAELTGRDDLVFFGGPVQPDALLFAFRSAVKPSRASV